MPLLDLFIQFRFRYIKNLGNSIIDFFSQIKGLFRTFGIIDVVDIIFVAALIYLVVRVKRNKGNATHKRLFAVVFDLSYSYFPRHGSFELYNEDDIQ